MARKSTTWMEEKIAVVFDICSSSEMLEDLAQRQNERAMKDLIRKLKNYLQEHQRPLGFELYKFTGDGWILLFPSNTEGTGLLTFLTNLLKYFKEVLSTVILPRLETAPNLRGMTFGVDKGRVLHFVLAGNAEYIGRPINVASRLQTAVKDHLPGHQVLISRPAFNDFRGNFQHFDPQDMQICLKNIRGGRPFNCVKLSLPVSLCRGD